jgi:hypothetical protein
MNISKTIKPRKLYPKTRKPISHGPHKQRWFIAGHVESKRILRSNNQRRFAQLHKLSGSGISACLHGKLKSHKGWVFKWEDAHN